jgi:DNA-binding transcriptional LysR family regulator
MEAAAAAFERTSSGDLDTVAGTVRITASDVVGTEVLPAMLAELRERHPALVVEVHLSNRTEDLLRQDADLAVRMVRPAQGALVARHVGAIPLGFFAGPSYVQRHGVPRTAAELGNFALIGPDRDTRDLEALRALGLADLPRGAMMVRTDNQVAQLAAIRAGLGIGICQVPLARRAPVLVAVLPELRLPALEAWIVMHEDLRRVRRVRAAFDHLAAAFARYAKG